MARENVDSLIDELDDFVADISSIANDNKAVTFIIGLEQLANDSASFGGKIAQICPSRIREQKESLENALKQFADACKIISGNLNSLKEMLENMPLKELRGANISSASAKAQLEKSIGIDNNGVIAQAPVMVPNAPVDRVPDTGPKSAMLQNESTIWSSLKGHFKFTEGLKTGFDWNAISGNIDKLGIDVSATTEAPKETLFESIISSGLPKNAGDLNSKPDPRDAYDYNNAYADVLPGEVPHYAESNEPIVEQETSTYRMTESVEEPVESSKPQRIDEQGHELFKHVDVEAEKLASQSLKDAMASFKENKDFDFSNIEMEIEDGDNISLEGHFVD